MNYFRQSGVREMRRGISRGAAGGQGSHERAPGEMAAFMAIASQRPIVGRLGGGSNLAEEVVVFCILVEQKSRAIQRTGGSCHTLNLFSHVQLKTVECLVMTSEFGRWLFFSQDAVKQKDL